MNYLKSITAGIITLFLLLALFAVWKEKTQPNVSAEQISLLDKMEKNGAPNFQAKTLSGKEISLYQFKGKVVIVNMWASWCGPCIEEVPSLISLVEAMKGDVQIIAISQDSSQDDIESFLKAFPKVNNENIHIVWDQTRELMKLYGTERLPESFVLNSNMKLVKKIVGTINWHTPESVEYLKTLLKGQ